MKLLAIDPGCHESAWLVYDDGEIVAFGKDSNIVVREVIVAGHGMESDHLAIEMIASYGMAVGKEVFETCVWIGRFIEAWGKDPSLVYRREVKMHLCGSMKARDSNIRQALIDRFGPPGTKANPGGTFGISKDVWAALGVAVTFSDAEAK